jgi:hypothetical protein
MSKKLPKDVIRLHWTSQCDYISYDDFSANIDFAKQLAIRMKASNAVSNTQVSRHGASQIADFMISVNNSVIGMIRRLCKGNRVSPSLETSQTTNRRASSDTPTKFIAVCLHSGIFSPCPAHLKVTPISDDNVVVNSDQKLFRQLKKLYQRERIAKLALELHGIYFVKVCHSYISLLVRTYLLTSLEIVLAPTQRLC